jgi:hypothetical protein
MRVSNMLNASYDVVKSPYQHNQHEFENRKAAFVGDGRTKVHWNSLAGHNVGAFGDDLSA